MTQRIYDSDAHILEPPDIWTNWLPERYQDRAPKLVKDHEATRPGKRPQRR